MSITVHSTSDTAEAVTAANAPKPAEETTTEGAPVEGTSALGADGSGQESTEVSEATETEDGDEELDAAAKLEADAANQAPKKKGGFQRRIDKLNARVTAKEQEV